MDFTIFLFETEFFFLALNIQHLITLKEKTQFTNGTEFFFSIYLNKSLDKNLDSRKKGK